ncbi:MAG: DUF4407 domain-containing protein [Saccharothrix sp.]|nr:DUF4407 domain-containing protein [Saccharothrix sp.]
MPPSSARRSLSPALGRWVRRLGGGTDALSALNPRDRLIYTTTGLLLLMTSTLGAVATGLAITLVVPELPWPVVVLLAAMWGLITSSLDRLLVMSSPGWGIRGLLHAAPTLAMSSLLGLVIAEPLVLRIFRPALDQRVGSSAGVLDRLRALEEIGRDHPSVTVVTWTLRVLFTVLVCLPVLVRLVRRRTVQDDVFEYLVGKTRTTRARSHLRLVERAPSRGRTG